MFKSGTKRTSEERKTKKVKHPATPEASALPSKGKSWRRMKEVRVKKCTKNCPESPSSSNSDGGFSQLEPIAAVNPPDASAPSASVEMADHSNPSIKIEIDVEMQEEPGTVTKSPDEVDTAVQTEENLLEPEPEPELPTVPPPPVERRSSKSEPAANVYLKQRRVVTRSKFLMDQRKNSGIPADRMTRYQKLARDTKNLVARLSGGEIPSPEKMRKALKVSSVSSGTHPQQSTEITNPDFCCDEETAAILLAELEGHIKDTETAATASGADDHPDADYYPIPESSLEPFLRTQRFAQLRSLYRSLERLNDLERSVSGSRMPVSAKRVIDFDLWRRLRQHERAQAEMRHLSTWLHAAQRQGNCYFGKTAQPSGGSVFDWQNDAGLRIRQQSVRKLTQKFRSMERFGSQSLPRNFNSAVRHGLSSAPEELAHQSVRQRRSSSLSSRQMQTLKEQLSKVYANDPTAPAAASAGSRTQVKSARAKLFVRSASDSARRMDDIRQSCTPSASKALSISGADASAPTKGSSTRAAIDYLQQLSREMSHKLTNAAASGPSVPSGANSGARNDSRMSASSDDYLLVLTPRPEDKRDDVEEVVKEWAEAEVAVQPPELPKRSSSFIRNDEDTVSSTNSSVQTVIHRDVQDKVDYFEHVIANSGHPHRIRTSQSFCDIRTRSAEHLEAKPRSKSLTNRSDETLMELRLNQLLSRARKNSSASISGRKNPVSGDWSDYLHLVKKGDVVNKCHYFTGSLPVSPVPKAAFANHAGIRNSTVVKGHEKGNVDYTKQRYEQVRRSRSTERTPLPASGSRRSHPGSSPRGPATLLDVKSGPSFSWARGFFSTKKQVSFPTTPAAVRKKPDFTKVKPTRLSSARLALRQSKNSQLQASPASALGLIGKKGSSSKPELSKFRNSGSFSDVASSCNSSIANYRSCSQGSVCSRSPIPAQPIRAVSADAHRLRSPSPLARTSHGPVTVPRPSSTGSFGRKESSAFDPSMHKPTFRYTPPPPRVRKNVIDMYATYPRRRLHDRPPRPPLPASFIRKVTSPSNPPGCYDLLKKKNDTGIAVIWAELAPPDGHSKVRGCTHCSSGIRSFLKRWIHHQHPWLLPSFLPSLVPSFLGLVRSLTGSRSLDGLC